METTTLAKVKIALRITTLAFDDEIQDLIDSCIAEMTMLGIYREELATDKQILTAIIAYCKWQFGNNDDAERWEKIYFDKLTKLQIASGYGNSV